MRRIALSWTAQMKKPMDMCMTTCHRFFAFANVRYACFSFIIKSGCISTQRIGTFDWCFSTLSSSFRCTASGSSSRIVRSRRTPSHPAASIFFHDPLGWPVWGTFERTAYRRHKLRMPAAGAVLLLDARSARFSFQRPVPDSPVP